MGNFFTIASTASTTIRVVRLDGAVQEFHEPISAGTLALSNPNFLVCHPAYLRVGLRPRALHTNAVLQFGILYFLVPVRFFQSSLTAAHLSSLLEKATASAPSPSSPSKKAKKCPSQPYLRFHPQPFWLIENGHILQIFSTPEILKRLIEEGLLPGSSKVPNISVCSTPDMHAKYLRHLIARSRLWMPRLDTIEEIVGS